MFEVIGREYDDIGEWTRTLRYEAFPQTATWSIPIWELIYEIEPDDTLSLEYRRGRILSKKLSTAPINPARIEAALSALTGAPVNITENIAPYVFKVEVGKGLTAIDLDLMLRTLRRKKPSHLSFNVIVKEELWINDYYGIATSKYIREYHIEEGELFTDVTDYHAAATAEYPPAGRAGIYMYEYHACLPAGHEHEGRETTYDEFESADDGQ
jgi:hypothetical protein